ncbi:SET domain-containing protein [Peniophora sp. CONT]|nr:SET domain-containing protein [Peniophora sp. CONT]
MPSATTPESSTAPLNIFQNPAIQNTTYQPDAPENYQSSFQLQSRDTDSRKIDYSDNEYCVTTFPQPETEELARDGRAEVMCTGWFKRKVLSTPGFPSPIVHPPNVTYEVREAKGRGLAVFATEDIGAGDLIVAERPLIVKPIWSIGSGAKNLSTEQQLRGMYVDMEKSLELICSRMSPEGLKQYTSLYNSHKTDGSGPLSGIGRTNGFDVGVADPKAPAGIVKQGKGRYSTTGAISSRFNHSCSPNAAHSFNLPSFSMEIHAVRPIAKGEEITVTYATLSATAANRQTSLKPYGFTCLCPACKNPATSDQERKRAITSLLPKSSQGVEHAETVLAAYEATGLQSHPRYPELLRRVAKLHKKKGSKERADALETLANRVTTAQDGRNPDEDTPDSLPPMETHIMTSPVDMMKFIIGQAPPSAREGLMQQFMETMNIRG